MPWVKMDDAFFTDEAVMAACPSARLLFLAGLCHASRNLTDGAIDKRALPSIAALAGAEPADADLLVELGLWVEEGANYRAPHYLDFNPSREKVIADRAAASERMKARRSGEVPANNGRSSPSPSRPVPMDPCSPPRTSSTTLPAGLWKKVAQKQAQASKTHIGDVTSWCKTAARNAQSAQQERAEWLWATYEITESQLVDVILAGGSSPLLNSLSKRAA